ncbi:hypothetical protein [Prevotella sp.]|uniref:hypothetical protein n=1 Tax=Prevotella sp. TaxID=59823 RepID=UPI00307803DE
MKHYLRFILVLLLSTVWCVGGYSQETKSVTCTLGKDANSCTSTGDCTVTWKYSSNPTTTNQAKNGMYWAIKANQTVTLTAKLGASDATITSVVITAYTNDGTGKTIEATVGGKTFGKEITLTNSSTDYTLEGSASGDLALIMKSTSSKKSHIVKTVKINYTDASSSNKTATTLSFPNEPTSFATTDDLTFFKGKTATLKAGETELTGKKIEYSKTGDEIFSSFNETTGALVLNGKTGTATVTAKFAGDDTYASSTASYTITVDQVFADLASLKAAIPATANSVDDAVPFRLKLTDALVTYVNGRKAYVQDATTGVLLFDNAASDNAFGLVAGQKFTGFVDVKACLYNGMAEVTAWTPAADVVKEENVDVPVKTVTLAELNGADYSKYECVRVKVENATVSTAYSTAKKATIKQGDETYLIHGETNGLDVNKDDVCDFIGYPIYWKTTSSNEHQLSVWSQDDIIVKSSVVKTTLSFDPATKEYNVDNNNKDAFTAPTATVKDAEGNVVEGAAITYTSSDPSVATVGETDGKVTFVGLGTTVITASYAGDDTYAEASASYTLTVKDPNKLEVTFDFVNNKYGYGIAQVPVGAKFKSEDVTITHVKNGTQNKTAFYGDSFRVYYGSQLNISVAAGYYMTKIVFDNIKDNTFSCTPGTLNGNVWEGTASSIDLDVNGTNQFKTITVSYAKCPEVVVDENATQDDMLNLIIKNSNKVVNAKLNRTLIADGGWYTFSVPFDVKDVNSTALSGAEIRKYKSMNGSIMEFEATTELKAGHAYLVKPSVDITTPIFNSVTLSEGDNLKDGVNGYEFIATLGSTELKTNGTNLFLGADNKFYIPTETGKIMKALRGYFVAPSGESGSKMGINIDGETNYISTLNGSAVVYGKVYNLNGQYVGNDVKSLKKGVYVVNGRKFIVK